MWRFEPILKCVNCGINQQKGVWKSAGSGAGAEGLEPGEREVLVAWLKPKKVTDACKVCKECAALLAAAAAAAAGADSPRRRGHAPVCALCGCSLLRVRAHRLDAPHRPEPAYLRQHCSLFEVDSPGEVCHACWMMTTATIGRDAKQAMKAVAADKADDTGAEGCPREDVVASEDRDAEGAVASGTRRAGWTLVRRLKLDGYTKVPASESCVACGEVAREGLGLGARRELLLRRRRYAASAARVCAAHARAAAWPDTLARTSNAFTADEITDMLFMTRSVRPLELTQPARLDAHARRLWLGVRPEQFEACVAGDAGLRGAGEAGRLGLAAWLAGRRAGAGVKVVATVTQRASSAVARALQLAARANGLPAPALRLDATPDPGEE